MNEKHGGWKNERATYQCWQDMKQRCLNEKHKQYVNYGGRGIGICERWLYSFENFFADMGRKPEGKTIDRINNNAGYSKDNCRWATPSEQRLNQRSCVFLEFDGKRMTIEEWGRHLGRHPTTIRTRIKSGYPLEMVLCREEYKTGRAYAPDFIKNRSGNDKSAMKQTKNREGA